MQQHWTLLLTYSYADPAPELAPALAIRRAKQKKFKSGYHLYSYSDQEPKLSLAICGVQLSFNIQSVKSRETDNCSCQMYTYIISEQERQCRPGAVVWVGSCLSAWKICVSAYIARCGVLSVPRMQLMARRKHPA